MTKDERPATKLASVLRLEEECRANQRDGVLTRLTVALPEGATRCQVRIRPEAR
jgi:hypothetical protein